MPKIALTTAEEIQHWCINHIANLLGEAPSSVDVHADFDSLGLDSALAVSMLLDLEELLGDMPIPPDVLFEHTTIHDVSKHLARQAALFAAAPSVEGPTIEESPVKVGR